MSILTEEVVEQQLRLHDGNMASVGRACGVTRHAVHQYISSRPHLRQVYEECREIMLDDGESSLYKAVKEGQSWAVTFYLKTQGRKRGYVEKVEHVLTDEQLNTLITRELARIASERETALAAGAETNQKAGTADLEALARPAD